MAALNPKTLIVGIQDLNAIPYGATLRVKQHAMTTKNATYFNVGNKTNWNNRTIFSKFLQALRFARPWRDPFAAYHYSPAKWNQLESLIIRERFQRIIFTEIWTYRYLSAAISHRNGIELILDLHNVESDLQDAMPRTFINKWRSVVMRHMEERFVRQVDSVWVCSDVDGHRLHAKYGVNCIVIPNRILIPASMSEPTDKESIGFVGCFNYPPNEEAAMLLLREIQPRLGCTLHLVGKNPTPQIKAWQSKHNIIHGEVQSVSDALASVRTIAVPLRSGSGTRLKVLEAFAHGKPVVATAKAVEGLAVQDGVHYLKAETAQEFADKIKFLWNNPYVEDALRENARKLVQERYAWTS